MCAAIGPPLPDVPEPWAAKYNRKLKIKLIIFKKKKNPFLISLPPRAVAVTAAETAGHAGDLTRVYT